ncbi:AraC family transcriptional regulator [Acetobacter oryzoeni]|uniref:AraC family transcriptional regulator n=2 Tax=Acetobacter oryzoeni TaxID=2500548 RepID=A0A5B9GTS7_9PROT|nr:helix-turn-helix transcriptional regulator [Acetobacter oryzoeni]MCP1203732.1 helix-turn-helix transcriptional regulator [Acetobacter oryzoeni]QEE86915.1 AraC family transcriptional regulator [Acetobacter oryzoeni]
MRDLSVDILHSTPHGMVALGNDYPDGHVIPRHEHRHGQLIFGASGTLILSTQATTWVMPPQRGLWIPPATPHDVQMLGKVSLQSIFVAPELTDGLPQSCQVVEIGSFLQALIGRAVDLPAENESADGTIALMNLIRCEMQSLTTLPLSLPFPDHKRLASLCRRFLIHPDIHDTIDDWCQSLRISRRTFTRLFRRETGLSFVEWRQQACLVAALPRLTAGESVTAVALALGYDNPAAFTTMFRQRLGTSPRHYLNQRR